MNARPSRQMTVLGLCAMAFYGVMLATGTFSVDVMPHFVISAVIFLSSGRIMRTSARNMPRTEKKAGRSGGAEPDWPWLTGLLNCTAAALILGVMAMLLLKPIDVSLTEALQFTLAPEQFFAHAVP